MMKVQLGRNARERRLVRSLVLGALLVVVSLGAKYFEQSDVEAVEGRPRLVDGDSFFMGAREVRMQDIDAPEGRQPCRRPDGTEWRCGEEAKRQLQKLIGGETVRCRVRAKDQHQRLLAYCSAGPRDLNAGMVAAGYAVAFGGYQREEAEARAAKRGIWNGTFDKPRDWRRDHMGQGGAP